MSNRFSISLKDIAGSWPPTDAQEQTEVINRLIFKCEELGEKNINKVSTAFRVNSELSELTKAIVSGISTPALMTYSGYLLLKYLFPSIIEFMKIRSQKEITVEYEGIRISVKGGGNFENELDMVIDKLKSLETPKIIK